MQIIAWTYDADVHCTDCAYKQFGAKLQYPEKMGKPIDSEGNEAHPMFDTDEWYANDVYEGNKTATLGCGDCHEVIEEVDLD